MTDATATADRPPADLVQTRFWSKVDRCGACRVWTAARIWSGYGIFRVGSRSDGSRRTMLAHRYAWQLEHGPIPAGLFVCHRCDNPACVRPSHLFLGDRSANMRDCAAKGRLARGENASHARLTAEQVLDIRRRDAAGERQADIGRRYGIGQSRVSAIALRKSWRHVA